jgi:uncharacterized protein
MHLDALIAALARPDAFPHPTDVPTVVHTHISVVFLAGEHAYKIKKPVDLGFLDFTTLDRRRHFCHEEVRLNRRLARDVYLGVVPIVDRGHLTVSDVFDPDDVPGPGCAAEGDGRGTDTIEYAVKMRRLPDARTFDALLDRGELGAAHLDRLARRIATFHENAASGPEVSRWGGLATVAGNVRENFAQIEPYVGETISDGVFTRLRDRAEQDLERLAGLIDARAARGVTRDTHGDLQLKHVYDFAAAAAPDDLVVVDCIEFNERFRFADPVADVAFLDMDLRARGRGDLARAFSDAYFAATGDAEGGRLLPFYTTYRAVVRGKVDGFAARETEIPVVERDRARDRARGYFLLALGVAAPPRERPALVLSTGLPGTGKSRVTRHLAQVHGFAPVSTDRVRKTLAGIPGDETGAAAVDQGIYTADWSDRTYDACLQLAAGLLFEGRRVVVDGTFREEGRRAALLEIAAALRVPALVVECQAPPEVVRDRLAHRQGDPSDADWGVYQALAGRWEAYGTETAPHVRVLDTARPDARIHADLCDILAREGLA